MSNVRIVEERDNYLLISMGDRYAVIERRNGLYYPMHAERTRGGVTLERTPSALSAKDWTDFAAAAQTLDDISSRRKDLAENIW